MKDLYNLKEMLVRELKEVGQNKSLDAGTLELVDKLAHSAKNVGKVIEMCEESDEYSKRRGMSRRDGMSMRDDMSYADDSSFARGRMRAPRDSMGRYSGNDGYSRNGEEKVIEVLDDLRSIVRELPNDAKYEVERIIKKHEDVHR